MLVSELIDKLKKCPQDSVVQICQFGYAGSFDGDDTDMGIEMVGDVLSVGIETVNKRFKPRIPYVVLSESPNPSNEDFRATTVE